FVPQCQAGRLVDTAPQDHVVEGLDHELERKDARAHEMAADELDAVVAVAHYRDVRVHHQLAAALAHVATKIANLERRLEALGRTPLFLPLVVLGDLDGLERSEPAQLPAADATLATNIGDRFDELDAAVQSSNDAASSAAFRDDHLYLPRSLPARLG